MKKRLREMLPHKIRLSFRRMIVHLAAWGLHFLRDLGNIVATNGLNVQRELGIGIERRLLADNTQYSINLQDFLFLSDFLKRQRTSSVDKTRIRISIVICAYNHASYTFRCLRALLPEIDLDDTEIIVINNASNDETSRLLSEFASVITVLTNSENVGFVKGCNQGGAIAAGSYLVFLNNDTVVHSGWLRHLIETVESDTSIGAVGSMLIYPNGLLQEAGGIVWSDGAAVNYGRGADTEDHRFAFAREVDYCSAAALLVRRDLFSDLGGFDERYSPAYYEDTDLCFGIRSLGFKVVYQPLARVTHWEGTTAGTDLEEGVKRYQKINQAKFLEKWREVLLSDHGKDKSGSIARAADRRRGPGIIVFDTGVPTPDQDSGSQRMFLILQSLARIGRPVLVPAKQALVGSPSLVGKHGIEVVSWLQWKKALTDADYQLAVLSRAAIADEILPLIRRINKDIKIIFDTVDLHSLRLEREYQITGDPRLKTEAEFRKEQELKAVRASDQIWCVTEYDKSVLKDEIPTAKIKIVPNIHLPRSRGSSFEDREGLLFIGSFLHRPNWDAIHYFVQTIFPLVCRSLPGVNLYVLGSHMTEDILSYGSDSIRCLGHVPDVDQFFQQSRVFVAPLRFGSGMKGKIGHALSYGLPVITTTIGAEGFGFANSCQAMVADDPAEFAGALIKAYTDRELWQRLSDHGYRYVEQNLSPELVHEQIANALREVLAGSTSSVP